MATPAAPRLFDLTPRNPHRAAAVRALRASVRAHGGQLVGLDVGTRHVGFALSDGSNTLARALKTVSLAPAEQRPFAAFAHALAARLPRRARRDRMADGRPAPGLAALVVGVPPQAQAIARLAHATALAVSTVAHIPLAVIADEHMTSVEAAQTVHLSLPLAKRRTKLQRKRAIDARAAAIILQDVLDELAPLHYAHEFDDGRATDLDDEEDAATEATELGHKL